LTPLDLVHGLLDLAFGRPGLFADLPGELVHFALGLEFGVAGPLTHLVLDGSLHLLGFAGGFVLVDHPGLLDGRAEARHWRHSRAQNVPAVLRGHQAEVCSV
jgi:hypothetical protein